MPAVYCPSCFTRTSDRKSRCRKCGARIPGSEPQVLIGHLLVATVIGAAVTAGYGLVMYTRWDRWLKLFDRDDLELPEVASRAFQTAAGIGVAVFLVVTLLAVACLRKTPATRRHTPNAEALG